MTKVADWINSSFGIQYAYDDAGNPYRRPDLAATCARVLLSVIRAHASGSEPSVSTKPTVSTTRDNRSSFQADGTVASAKRRE
jgi:hypothetical protein